MGKDTSIIVSVDDIRTFEKLKLISQMAPVKERIRSFERKYGCNITASEEQMKAASRGFRTLGRSYRVEGLCRQLERSQINAQED